MCQRLQLHDTFCPYSQHELQNVVKLHSIWAWAWEKLVKSLLSKNPKALKEFYTDESMYSLCPSAHWDHRHSSLQAKSKNLHIQVKSCKCKTKKNQKIWK